MKNLIHWSRRQLIKTELNSYTDAVIYRVPYSGQANESNMWKALQSKVPTRWNGIYDAKGSLDIRAIEPDAIIVALHTPVFD